MSNPIVRYVQKQLFAQKGAIANRKAVDFSAAKMAERLSEFGFDPRLIQDEKQLVQILNLIKGAEDQAFAEKFKGILAPKKSAKVFSLKDKKEIPNPERNIMGGQAFETEEEIAKRITKENQKGLAKIRARQKMLEAINADAYNGVDLFEGTAPLNKGGDPGDTLSPQGPLSGVSPSVFFKPSL